MPTPKLKAEYDRLHPRDGVYDPTIHMFDYPEAPEVPGPDHVPTWAWGIIAGTSVIALIIVVTLGVSA